MRAAAIISGGVFALALAFGLTRAEAAAITFTATGSASDGALAASAAFTTGNGFIDVTLTNLLGASVIRSAGQALSDISFTLSNAPGTLTGRSILSAQLGNVSSTGVVTYVSGSPVRFLGEGPPPPTSRRYGLLFDRREYDHDGGDRRRPTERNDRAVRREWRDAEQRQQRVPEF